MKKFIIVTLILGAIAGSIYYYLDTATPPKVKTISSKNQASSTGDASYYDYAVRQGKNAFSSGAEKAGNLFTDASALIADKAQALFGKGASDIKNETYGAISSGFTKAESGIADVLGVKPSDNPANTAAVMYSVKVNTPVYFTIKNIYSAPLFKYSIGWGDESRENGELKSSETARTVSHNWAKEGEYSIRFTIASDKGTIDSQSYISVIQ